MGVNITVLNNFLLKQLQLSSCLHLGDVASLLSDGDNSSPKFGDQIWPVTLLVTVVLRSCCVPGFQLQKTVRICICTYMMRIRTVGYTSLSGN